MGPSMLDALQICAKDLRNIGKGGIIQQKRCYQSNLFTLRRTDLRVMPLDEKRESSNTEVQ